MNEARPGSLLRLTRRTFTDLLLILFSYAEQSEQPRSQQPNGARYRYDVDLGSIELEIAPIFGEFVLSQFDFCKTIAEGGAACRFGIKSQGGQPDTAALETEVNFLLAESKGTQEVAFFNLISDFAVNRILI
jgi:hypothetical protein